MTVRAGKTPDGPKVAIAGISAVGTEFMRVRARPRRTRLHARSTLRARAPIGPDREKRSIERRDLFAALLGAPAA